MYWSLQVFIILSIYDFSVAFKASKDFFQIICHIITIFFRKPNHGFLSDDNMRIVITAPDKDLLLQEDDIAFMLVQYDKNEEEENSSDQK